MTTSLTAGAWIAKAAASAVVRAKARCIIARSVRTVGILRLAAHCMGIDVVVSPGVIARVRLRSAGRHQGFESFDAVMRCGLPFLYA